MDIIKLIVMEIGDLSRLVETYNSNSPLFTILSSYWCLTPIQYYQHRRLRRIVASRIERIARKKETTRNEAACQEKGCGEVTW
jgi:hypothetical protein